jgi:DNA replication and repair protein RecF
LNGAATQGSADLGEIVQVVWLTPAMDRLFSDGAGERRRFFDRLTLAFEPGHANTHTRYHAALRERAKLLKFGPRDPVWLDGLEDEMAVSGTAIAAARARTVLLLNRALSERSSAGTFPAAQLELSGEIDSFQSNQGPECEAAFRKRLSEYRVRDAQTGRTNIGPHLSDIEVRHTAKRMDARACSTGEQKALLISIVLAHARELARARDGVGPILLLDEIAAHLDSVRRVALFDEILLLGTQAWMTGTDRSLFDAISGRAEIYAVAGGQPVREA